MTAVVASMLLCGGPYSNLEATQAVLAKAEELKISPRRILCTGDVVAYCADPQPTVDLIRRTGIAVVMGNCEESVGADSDDCGCGFEKGSACDLLTAQWYNYSIASLDSDAKAWMRNLPRRISFEMSGLRLIAVHGGVDQINRFVFPSTPETEKAAELDLVDADGIIGGHSGLPFTQIVNGRIWHNPGVIGMPANDGTPRLWYSILRPVDRGIVFEHHPETYNHRAAAKKMRERKLPSSYADALETGLWANDDFLPDDDRGMRGIALFPQAVDWQIN